MSSTCAQCGEPTIPDPFGDSGIPVHDVDALGERAIDLDEDHVAAPVQTQDTTPGAVIWTRS